MQRHSWTSRCIHFALQSVPGNARQIVSCKCHREGYLKDLSLDGLCEKGCDCMDWRRFYLLIADCIESASSLHSVFHNCIVLLITITKCLSAHNEVGTCGTILSLPNPCCQSHVNPHS